MSRRAHHGVSDLTKAAVHRKLDARRLLHSEESTAHAASHTRGAAYLAGYSIECKLKSLAMQARNCVTLQQLALALGVDERHVYTHGLEVLWKHMPALWKRFRRSEVFRDFRRVNAWRPAWRYNPLPLPLDEAIAFLESVERSYAWLENNRG